MYKEKVSHLSLPPRAHYAFGKTLGVNVVDGRRVRKQKLFKLRTMYK